jgi:hypothetical protein
MTALISKARVTRRKMERHNDLLAICCIFN